MGRGRTGGGAGESELADGVAVGVTWGHATALGEEEPLEDAVFKRVEGDHGQPTPRTEVLDRDREKPFKLTQLIVYRDP
jgi:hypothetical protein